MPDAATRRLLKVHCFITVFAAFLAVFLQSLLVPVNGIAVASGAAYGLLSIYFYGSLGQFLSGTRRAKTAMIATGVLKIGLLLLFLFELNEQEIVFTFSALGGFLTLIVSALISGPVEG